MMLDSPDRGMTQCRPVPRDWVQSQLLNKIQHRGHLFYISRARVYLSQPLSGTPFQELPATALGQGTPANA